MFATSSASRPADCILLIAHADPRFEAGLSWRLAEAGLTVERARPGPFAFERPLRSGVVGAIAYVANDHERDLLLASDLPAVAIGGSRVWGDVATVTVSQAIAGRLAAEHLLRRGHREFGCLGLADNTFSEGRTAGFIERLGKAGYHCREYVIPIADRGGYGGLRPDAAAVREVGRWLDHLPRPIGVFAVNDALALILFRLIKDRAWRLPEDIALLGMDDSAAAAAAELSSVRLPSWRWGASAGSELLRRLQEPTSRPTLVTVPPDEIAQRASTVGSVHGDALVEQAQTLIRERGTTLTVAGLAVLLGVSERLLLRRFRRCCASSPSQVLRERRVQEARLHLSSSAASLAAVARRCGFASRQGMARAFAELHGTRPADYRSLRRGRRPSIEP